MFDDVKDPKSDIYKEKMEWLEEKYATAIKSRKTGWMIARFTLVVAVLEALALMFLVPLKSVEPYTIEVNTLTGETNVKKPLKEGVLTQSEALTKYWLIRYVRARVGYDFQDIEEQYKVVNWLSERKEFSRYAKSFDPKKETSPYNLYGEKVQLKVRVKSISFVDKDTASIRIDVTKVEVDGSESVTPWVVTTSYQFTLEPRSEEERFENPLGFQVTNWRVDAEVIE